MNDIVFENNALSGLFTVPCDIVDKYINIAALSEIKVLLFVLKNCNLKLSQEDICSACDISKEELTSAIAFWTRCEIISKRGGKYQIKVEKSVSCDSYPKYTTGELADITDSDKDFSSLLKEVEKRRGKLLSPQDVNTFYGMYNWLGLKSDVILCLVAYCDSIGKTGMRYIEKVAVTWCDEGIDTFERAEEYIRKQQEKHSIENIVMTAFGISGRALTPKEKEHIERWSGEWNFDISMIKEAYNRCVDKKGTLNFAYINGILGTWERGGIKKAEDISDSKSGGEKETSFDIDEIMRKAHERVHGKS